MIAQQARFHKISDAFDNMQDRMGKIIRSVDGAYDQVVIDCAPGLSQLVWGALRIADLVLIPYIPDRTAEDNVGWLAHRLKEISGAMSCTVANRVSGQDSRAQGIISTVERQVLPARRPDPRHPAARHRARLSRQVRHAGLEVRLGRPARQCAGRRRAQCRQPAHRGGRRMTQAPVTRLLRRIFDVVVREAEHNRGAGAKARRSAIAEDLAAEPVIAEAGAAQAFRRIATPRRQHSEAARRVRPARQARADQGRGGPEIRRHGVRAGAVGEARARRGHRARN